MDLTVSPVRFGAKFNKSANARPQISKIGKFTDKLYDYASPAGWVLLVSLLLGSVSYYGIKEIKNYNRQKNSVEATGNTLQRDTFTLTQE